MEINEEENNIKEKEGELGPLSLLKDAVKTNSQILIYCRNNRKLLGRIRAFDSHMNIILEAVCEIWSEMMKGKNKQHKLRNRERFISKMFLRGDSIILIVKNPNNTKLDEEKKSKKEKKKENEDKYTKESNIIGLDEEQKSDDEDEKKIGEENKKDKKKHTKKVKEESSEELTENEKKDSLIKKRKRE